MELDPPFPYSVGPTLPTDVDGVAYAICFDRSWRFADEHHVLNAIGCSIAEACWLGLQQEMQGGPFRVYLLCRLFCALNLAQRAFCAAAMRARAAGDNLRRAPAGLAGPRARAFAQRRLWASAMRCRAAAESVRRPRLRPADLAEPPPSSAAMARSSLSSCVWAWSRSARSSRTNKVRSTICDLLCNQDTCRIIFVGTRESCAVVVQEYI